MQSYNNILMEKDMKKLVSILAAAGLLVSTAAYATEAQTLELKDGSKIEVLGESVAVINEDGSKAPAPDGTHTLADGTTITTKDGHKVAQ